LALEERRYGKLLKAPLTIQNAEDEVFSSYGEKVMNGQSCRFWPFGAVENKGLLAAHSRN